MSLYCYPSALPLSTVGRKRGRGRKPEDKQTKRQHWKCLPLWGCWCYFEGAINITLSFWRWVSQWVINFGALRNKSRHACLVWLCDIKLFCTKNKIKLGCMNADILGRLKAFGIMGTVEMSLQSQWLHDPLFVHKMMTYTVQYTVLNILHLQSSQDFYWATRLKN